jgi:hypothetical protein
MGDVAPGELGLLVAGLGNCLIHLFSSFVLDLIRLGFDFSSHGSDWILFFLMILMYQSFLLVPFYLLAGRVAKGPRGRIEID